MSSSSALNQLTEKSPAPGRESVSALVRGYAARSPDAAAVITADGDALDYAGLADTMDALAGQLRAAGIGATDRVVTVLSGSVDSALLLLAVLAVGVCVPVNPACTDAEFRTILETAGASAVIEEAPSRIGPAAEALGIPLLRFPGRHNGCRIAGSAARNAGSAIRNAAPADDLPPGTLLLRTSGTTTSGKLVPVDWPTMLAGATASARAYELGPADRRLNIQPLFHIQAVVGSLLCALSCGSSVVLAAPFVPQRTLDLLTERGVTWFSATPTMHQKILDTAAPAWRRPPGLRFVRVGSSALPRQLRAELEEFYQVPVVESYGMTEAHQIASTPLPGRTATSGLVPTGSRIAVLDATGEPVETPGVRGEIVVSGDNVISGYLWPPQDNQRSFVRNWFRTGDAGELRPDGSLLIVGRIKELINRGGEKISPAEVEQVLLDHPAVEQAAAFGIPDPVWTERVGAAVVIRPGHEANEAELRGFARGRLAAFKVPSRVVFRDELPLTGTGKVSRRLLTEESATAAPAVAAPAVASDRPDRVPPRTSVEAALVGIWSHALRADGIGVEDDFFALGGESLQAVALLSMVREVFGVEIAPLALFDEVSTVSLMSRLVSRQRTTAPSDR